MNKNVLIIDGNNLGWRAYGRVPLTFNGKRTEVVFIGLRMLRFYMEEFDPDKCVVVWDGGLDKQRTNIFPDYKQHRRERTKEENDERIAFHIQMKNFQNVIHQLGINQYQCKGREADDIIYTLVKKEASQSSITIVSTDTDMLTLVSNSNVNIYSPIKKELINCKNFIEKFKFSPILYIAYKALVGDKSDNISGVKGIGPVKAQKILIETPTMLTDELLENKEFLLSYSLIMLIQVPEEELNAGFIEGEKFTKMQMTEKIISICNDFGFQEILDRMSSFCGTFEHYIAKRNET